MVQRRTLKVLVALVAAMTIGTGLLVLINGEPVRPMVRSMAAVTPSVEPGTWITDTNVPIARGAWSNIVISSSDESVDALERRFHFIIYPSDATGRVEVVVTGLWQEQVCGKFMNTAGYDYNSDSIGICLIGDFSAQKHQVSRTRTLAAWTRAIQRYCSIPSARVYLHRELDPRKDAPGNEFPHAVFNRLLNSGR